MSTFGRLATRVDMSTSRRLARKKNDLRTRLEKDVKRSRPYPGTKAYVFMNKNIEIFADVSRTLIWFSIRYAKGDDLISVVKIVPAQI